jgi:protocatechuate 4,5-dioxygenase, alpha chain
MRTLAERVPVVPETPVTPVPGTEREARMSAETPIVPESRFDVPGTPVFDGHTARRGFRMNKLFMSLVNQENRKTFAEDEAAYCDAYDLSPEQKKAVLERDWQAMIDLGGSIFYVYKLAMIDGRSMQYLGGVFSGMTEEEFAAMMRAGGRRNG